MNNGQCLELILGLGLGGRCCVFISLFDLRILGAHVIVTKVNELLQVTCDVVYVLEYQECVQVYTPVVLKCRAFCDRC